MQSCAGSCGAVVAAAQARLLGLVLQALEDGSQRESQAAVTHIGRQVRRQAQPLEGHLHPRAASGDTGTT